MERVCAAVMARSGRAWLVALLVSACGGGSGDAGDTGDIGVGGHAHGAGGEPGAGGQGVTGGEPGQGGEVVGGSVTPEGGTGGRGGEPAEGGAGGEVGGSGGDVGGAGGEPVGGGGAGGEPGPPPSCDEICFAAARCATQAEFDYCPGIWFVETRDVIAACGERCAAEPEFAARMGGAPDCGGRVEIMKENEDFAAICEQGTPLPPDVPACDVRGQRLAECLGERCPNALGIETGVAKLFALGCEGGVAFGALTPEQAATVGAETPCDDTQIDQQVGDLIASGARQLFLPPFDTLCSAGSAVPEGHCAGLCENALECAPATSPLHDGDICVAACVPGASEEFLGQAACASAAATCDDFARCYTGG